MKLIPSYPSVDNTNFIIKNAAIAITKPTTEFIKIPFALLLCEGFEELDI